MNTTSFTASTGIMVNHNHQQDYSSGNDLSVNTSTTSQPISYPLAFWIFLSVETLITILGNALLCLVFLANKKLRTGQNYFVLSLSLGDMLGGMTIIPCEYCRLQRNLGPCQFLCGSALSFMMTTTVINLFLIAHDKQLAIQSPYAYLESFTKRRALTSIGCGWMVSLLLTSLPGIWAYWDKSHEQIINLIFSKLSFGGTIIAGVYMGVVYSRIVRKVRHERRRKGSRPVNRAGVKACIGCTLVFFISWLQYCVMELLMQYNHVSVPLGFIDASYFLLLLSPCLDCILYAYYRRDFRHCLVLMLKSARKCFRGDMGMHISPELLKIYQLATSVRGASQPLSGTCNPAGMHQRHLSDCSFL